MRSALSRRHFLIGTGGLLVAVAAGCALDVVESLAPPGVSTRSPGPSPQPSAGSESTQIPTPTAIELRAMAAGMLIVGFRGRELGPGDPILQWIGEEGLGGVVLFARNVASREQLADLSASMSNAAGERPLFIAVDQEGGAVARLTSAKGFADLPSARDVGRAGDAEAARQVGRTAGEMLASVGINYNLAPVVDLDVNPGNPSIGALGRSFSDDPTVVTAMAGAFVEGQREHGVITALKHFPGLGSATGNTDREFVDVTHTWTEQELEPYRALIDAGLADTVMVANALNGKIDRRFPATLSDPTLELLRGELGWAGVVITDDLQAGALRDNYGEREILRRAIQAGNDLLLFAATGPRDDELAPRLIDTIVNLVESGEVDRAQLEQSHARIGQLSERILE